MKRLPKADYLVLLDLGGEDPTSLCEKEAKVWKIEPARCSSNPRPPVVMRTTWDLGAETLSELCAQWRSPESKKIAEAEVSIGLNPSATDVAGVTTPLRLKWCWDALPTLWLIPVLKEWARIITGGGNAVLPSMPWDSDAVMGIFSLNTAAQMRRMIELAVESDQDYQKRVENPGDGETVKGGLLYKKEGLVEVLQVPRSVELRRALVESVHDVFHFGYKRTYYEAKRS
ncbi:MAG: hypothetical protein ACO33E_06860, partial [Aquiluna sp.]